MRWRCAELIFFVVNGRYEDMISRRVVLHRKLDQQKLVPAKEYIKARFQA